MLEKTKKSITALVKRGAECRALINRFEDLQVSRKDNRTVEHLAYIYPDPLSRSREIDIYYDENTQEIILVKGSKYTRQVDKQIIEFDGDIKEFKKWIFEISNSIDVTREDELFRRVRKIFCLLQAKFYNYKKTDGDLELVSIVYVQDPYLCKCTGSSPITHFYIYHDRKNRHVIFKGEDIETETYSYSIYGDDFIDKYIEEFKDALVDRAGGRKCYLDL